MVSAPKVPSNARARLVAAVLQRELLVDGQVGAAVVDLHEVLRVGGRAPPGATAGTRRAMRSVRSSTTRSNARLRRFEPGRGWTSAAGRGRLERGAGCDEFLVGGVADGDDQVVRVASRTSSTCRGRAGVSGRVASGRGDRAGMDRRARGGCPPRSPGRGWCRSTARRRAGSGPSCGCRRTPPGPRRAAVVGRRTSRASGHEREVGAAAVGFGAVPGDQRRPLQHTHMVGEQVRRHRRAARCSSAGDASPERECVDDRQPTRITQGGVHGSPPHQLAISLRSH